MVWLKDLFSPSNLWTAFQFCFPAAAAAVSAWLSYLWSLPPSVTIFLAFVTAATGLIIITTYREQSLAGKVTLLTLETKVWTYNPETELGAVRFRALIGNAHRYESAYFNAEVLSIFIFVANRTNPHQRRIGGPHQIPPSGGWREFILPEVGDVPIGSHEGRLHLRLFYGKKPTNLNHTLELRVLFRFVAGFDERNQLSARVSHFFLENAPS